MKRDAEGMVFLSAKLFLRASPSLFSRKKWMFLQPSFPAAFRANESADNGADTCIMLPVFT